MAEPKEAAGPSAGAPGGASPMTGLSAEERQSVSSPCCSGTTILSTVAVLLAGLWLDWAGRSGGGSNIDGMFNITCTRESGCPGSGDPYSIIGISKEEFTKRGATKAYRTLACKDRKTLPTRESARGY